MNGRILEHQQKSSLTIQRASALEEEGIPVQPPHCGALGKLTEGS